MNKQMAALITAILFGSGGIYGGYYTLKAEAKNTVEDVKKLEEKAEKTQEEVTENEKIDIQQSMLIQRIAETLANVHETMDKLDQKIDKNLQE